MLALPGIAALAHVASTERPRSGTWPRESSEQNDTHPKPHKRQRTAEPLLRQPEQADSNAQDCDLLSQKLWRDNVADSASVGMPDNASDAWDDLQSFLTDTRERDLERWAAARFQDEARACSQEEQEVTSPPTHKRAGPRFQESCQEAACT